MKHPTRTQAIRNKCLDCCCGSHTEVRRCTAQKCPLFPYRMGYARNGRYNNGIHQDNRKLPAKSCHSDASVTAK